MVAYGAADFHAASHRAHSPFQQHAHLHLDPVQTQQAQRQHLIQGLIALRPKKRTNKVSWVIFGGCAYFVAALLGDHSVREALLSPHGEVRAAQYVAAVPAAPRGPVQLQAAVQVQAPVQVQEPAPGQPAVVTFADTDAPSLDAPLPHAKAHHTAPTHRAHPRGAKRAK